VTTTVLKELVAMVCVSVMVVVGGVPIVRTDGETSAVVASEVWLVVQADGTDVVVAAEEVVLMTMLLLLLIKPLLSRSSRRRRGGSVKFTTTKVGLMLLMF
jgi:hypothetical protein